MSNETQETPVAETVPDEQAVIAVADKVLPVVEEQIKDKVALTEDDRASVERMIDEIGEPGLALRLMARGPSQILGSKSALRVAA